MKPEFPEIAEKVYHLIQESIRKQIGFQTGHEYSDVTFSYDIAPTHRGDPEYYEELDEYITRYIHTRKEYRVLFLETCFQLPNDNEFTFTCDDVWLSLVTCGIWTSTRIQEIHHAKLADANPHWKIVWAVQTHEIHKVHKGKAKIDAPTSPKRR